ncbi:Gfo/Idh/MocA family oxidoreductase [Desulfovibrio inopinatus]|uniref:Gfo/Idh/MocA family oxidoreductase n=1 Tax=Desulfovibrio inopinatus TaxID=102109 RepID=UPI000408E1C0|nr:Gfo/Idh/MocA family oxidoreductase [Desulfovibrio inopinatus]
MPAPIQTLCCGTRFGQVYLEGLRLAPDFALAGILARGNSRSQQLAQKYGVPLYTSLDHIPRHIEAACVVIRSSIVGGAGTEIALSLLRRGIHVIQEHPMHPREVETCQQTALRAGCVHYLNTHHVHMGETQKFLRLVHEIQQEQPICFINALCGVQVLCSLLDIIGMAVGTVTPYAFEEYSPGLEHVLAACDVEAFPYEVLRGHIAGTPVTLGVQNYYDSTDPDNNAAILHRMTVGFPSGNLTLQSAAGPLLWSDRLHFSRDIFDMENTLHPYNPISRLLSDSEGPSLSHLVEEQWPQAVAHALQEFHSIITDQGSLFNRYAYAKALCSMWAERMQKLGAPRLIQLTPPPRQLPKVIEAYLKK